MKHSHIKIVRQLVGIFVLVLTALLASCSSHIRRDGPPNFYVDETKVPNAVPKPEKLAKYGNMPSYVVFGKRYYTLRSSHNYDQVGTASWYGTQFDTHRTSSGERYSLLAMTAAHKTLPLPTYVEVTNLKNNRTVIVKVNDRGPFESNRLIDLSYVAAKKLGMLGHGTAKVRVKAIDPSYFNQQSYFAQNTSRSVEVTHPVRTYKNFALETPHHFFHPTRTTRSVSSADVYLQVGAFKNRAYAEKLQNQLMRLVSEPVRIIYPSGNSSLYRVKIGPLNDVASLERVTLRLRDLGIKSNKLYG